MEKQVEKKEEIPGVDEQQDGERLTDALIHEFIWIQRAACSVTYLLGGEFYQGSFIALKEKKKERKKERQECEMRRWWWCL